MATLTKTRKAALKRALARQGRIGRLREPDGTEVPEYIESGYRRALQRLLRQVERDVQLTVMPAARPLIQDAKTDPAHASIRQLMRKYADLEAYLSVASSMVNAIDATNQAQIIANTKAVLGVSLASVIEEVPVTRAINVAINRNVALIKSIPRQYLQRVRRSILTGIRTGSDDFSIDKDLREQFGISNRRARTIARDQTSKVNGALNETRQTGLGITHYTWSAAGDSLVRPSHEANDGKRFAWDNPPATGHPTEDVQCRCRAIPDLTILKSLVP